MKTRTHAHRNTPLPDHRKSKELFTANELNCSDFNKSTQLHDELLVARVGVTIVRRILVRGINAPLPPEAKKILKI